MGIWGIFRTGIESGPCWCFAGIIIICELFIANLGMVSTKRWNGRAAVPCLRAHRKLECDLCPELAHQPSSIPTFGKQCRDDPPCHRDVCFQARAYEGLLWTVEGFLFLYTEFGKSNESHVLWRPNCWQVRHVPWCVIANFSAPARDTPRMKISTMRKRKHGREVHRRQRINPTLS